MRRSTALLLALLVLVAACSSDDEGATSGGGGSTEDSVVDTDDSVVSTVAEPEACAPARAVTPGETEATITSSGVERRYRQDVPEGYDGTTPVPLFISLHGHGSNAIQQDVYSGMDLAAAEVDGIVLTPEGLGSPQAWGLNPEGVDIQLVSDLVTSAEETFCIDAARVAAVGISNGSALSGVAGCALAGQLSAVGLVAATVGTLGCEPDTRMSVIAFHGTADQTVPYDGGTVGGGGRLEGVGVDPAEEGIAAWAEQDGCTSGPEVREVAQDVDHWSWSGCDAGTAVEFYPVEGAGHVWPGSPIDGGALTDRLGPNTNSISASELIVDFVVAHPRVG